MLKRLFKCAPIQNVLHVCDATVIIFSPYMIFLCVSSVCWKMIPPNWALWNWSTSSSLGWRICMERWDDDQTDIMAEGVLWYFLNIFVRCAYFRWGQRWTLTCWNMMRTPSLLFCVCTAGELAGWKNHTPPIMDSFNACVCVCVFRGLVKLWSSLTLLGSYQNQACAFRVLQVSRRLFMSTNYLFLLSRLLRDKVSLMSLTWVTWH